MPKSELSANSMRKMTMTGSPAIHVAPATDFTLGGIHITNSMLYGWIITVVIIIGLIWAARRVTVHPRGGLMQYVEAGADFVTNLVEGAFNDKEVGRKYVSFFVTLFFFI